MRSWIGFVMLLLSVCAPAIAGDAPAPAPFLGITLDPNAGFDPSLGVVVLAIVPGSTCDHLGILAGDRLLEANGHALGTVDDFAKLVPTLQVGEPLTVRLVRASGTQTVSGPIERLARPKEIAEQTALLAQEAARISVAAQQPRPAGPALERTLSTLTQIEAALPQASADFRAQYPQGEFAMSIHIDIRSDRAASAPVMIGAHDPEAAHESAVPPRDPQPNP